MARDLICPACGKFGFKTTDVFVTGESASLKCVLCGEWSAQPKWKTVAMLIAEVEKLQDNHCADCCCAQSWKALGITQYTGKSIPEHIEELRDSLTRSKAEGETFRQAVAHIEEDRLGSYTICGKWTLTAELTTEEIEMSHYRTALERGRAEGKIEGMEEAAKIADDQNFDHNDCDGCRTARTIAAAIRQQTQKI